MYTTVERAILYRFAHFQTDTLSMIRAKAQYLAIHVLLMYKFW